MATPHFLHNRTPIIQVSDGEDVSDTRRLTILAAPLEVVQVRNTGVTLAAGDSIAITDHQLLYETNAGKATDDSAVRGGTTFRGVVRGGARFGGGVSYLRGWGQHVHHRSSVIVRDQRWQSYGRLSG